MSDLLAGWAKCEITPAVGQPMAGYIARTGTASGVLDALYVRALVLRQGKVVAAIVIADLLLISNRWADRLRERLARALATPPEHIVVAATHTHSGPLLEISPFHLFSQCLGAGARKCARWVEQRMEQAVAEAAASLRPVRLAQARLSIRNVASDRNRPERERNQHAFLLRFESAQGAALFVAYGCHPTILGAGSNLFSGDFHGAISRRLERSLDVALMANAAGANISTRFTRRRQTPAELARLASVFIRQVRAARFSRIPHATLSVTERRIRLSLRDLKRAEIKERPESGRLAVVAREAREILNRLRRSREFTGKSMAARVAALRIGQVRLVALPFEIYSDTGDFFWEKVRAVPICYANGYWGYIPSPAAAQEDYEAVASPFDARADGLLRREVIRLLSASRRAGSST